MRAPGFWQPDKGGAAALLLSPLGRLYGLHTRLRLMTARPWTSPSPVLCIGNLVAGGAGKTPLALDLGRRLLDRGKSVHFLTRGFGGGEKGPLRVDPEIHDHIMVGDEALLLAAVAPTWVAADRRAGCLAAAGAGAGLIVMDDGFQNPRVTKNFSIVVVDGGYGFGNARMIPAGPLRETISAGMARADACVVIGEDTSGVIATVSNCGLSPLRARLAATPAADDLRGKPVIAFAGIGRPEKFFATLASIGCTVTSAVPFADHHPYNDDDIARLLEIAVKADARLVTTEKDARRLPASLLDRITVVPVALEWDDKTALESLLDEICHA